MSRLFIYRLSQTTAALGIGLGSLIGYKAYKKSMKYEPTIKYPTSHEDIKLEKNRVEYNLKSREDHLKEATETEYDVLIIGGGCNGAGVLLEAASRGLKALLVEEYDFASGTSSKSTKLLHGGVRYLEEVFSLYGKDRIEKLELVVEALKERSYLLQNAQYMNKPLPTIIPTYSLFTTGYYYAGCLVYHLIYFLFDDDKNLSSIPVPYIIGRQEILNIFPKLDKKVKFGIVYFDGQMNDARMNMDVLLTSTLDNYIEDKKFKPANMLNYAKFVEFTKNQHGTITGGVICDKTTDKQYKIKTKCVVNCTGAFADNIRKLDNPEIADRIIPCEGSHIVMEKKIGHRKYGLLIPRTTDGRVLFVLPWLHHSLVGTTDQRVEKAEIDPTVPVNDMQFMVNELSKLYPETSSVELSSSILSKWSGIRPLVKEFPKEDYVVDNKKAVDTKSVSRKHVIEKTNSGLISLMGGKWTTYRKMSEETVDEVVGYLKQQGHNLEDVRSESITKELRLLGQFRKNQAPLDSYQRREMIRYTAKGLMERYNIDRDIAKHLVKTYGDRSWDVAKFFAVSAENKERLHEKHPITIGEIKYQLKYEMGISPIDILYRRTRLGFTDSEAVYQVLPRIINIFAQEFKWTDERKIQEARENLARMRKMNF